MLMLILTYLRAICKVNQKQIKKIPEKKLDKERTNVLLDKDMMISLKNLARLEGKSVTLLVREAITEYLSGHLIKNEFGIIGIGKSDIDTNNRNNINK